MEKKLILRGLLAGAVAGLAAFVFARIFAEPLIGRAVDYESARDTAQAALDQAAGTPVSGGEHEIFTRAVQANAGIGLGMIVLGAAMGALTAVVYAVCLGRTGRIRPRVLALLVAAGGFAGFYLMPFLKYPANPPSIGHEDTIRDRSNLYLAMVGCSIVLLVLAVWLGRRLAVRYGNWNATLLAGAGYAVGIGLVMWGLPDAGELAANVEVYGHHATETPLPLENARGTIVFPGFPADDLYRFRLYSVLAQALLWGCLGLVLGPLAERLLARDLPASPRPT
ncbi:hypothetical protein SRB5_11530 [Streptomyces sp. RB5]|uniref:Cobalt transporter n=1 Tax=Streptomyces smaragdinus TaxID=2585196 RepID=A0A7K0CC72_9ACTN|nr:CbtA family protein [Streptomyces smaragdinus]MQY11039.1 hypothetical protein [Streptomyces smaragdinus]